MTTRRVLRCVIVQMDHRLRRLSRRLLLAFLLALDQSDLPFDHVDEGSNDCGGASEKQRYSPRCRRVFHWIHCLQPNPAEHREEPAIEEDPVPTDSVEQSSRTARRVQPDPGRVQPNLFEQSPNHSSMSFPLTNDVSAEARLYTKIPFLSICTENWV